MKKLIYPITAFCLMVPALTMAQTSEKTARKIEKKIEVTEENGVKTVKVETTENGTTTSEIYTGEAADRYLNNQNGMNGNGTNSMFFKMDIGDDSLHQFNFDMKNFVFDEHINDMIRINLDSVMKDFNFEWNGEKMEIGEFHEEMKKLQEEMKNLHFEMKNFNWNDSLINFNNGQHKMIIIDDAELDEKTKEELKKMGIDIDVEQKNGKKVTSKVIVARMVMIEDMEQDKKLKPLEDVNLGFYPNPGDGNFTLEFSIEEDRDEAVITIHDITGKVVYTETVKGKGDYKKQISLDEPSGVYIIKIQQGKKAITKKLIIQ